jgi:hypothetical protein
MRQQQSDAYEICAFTFLARKQHVSESRTSSIEHYPRGYSHEDDAAKVRCTTRLDHWICMFTWLACQPCCSFAGPNAEIVRAEVQNTDRDSLPRTGTAITHVGTEVTGREYRDDTHLLARSTGMNFFLEARQ